MSSIRLDLEVDAFQSWAVTQPCPHYQHHVGPSEGENMPSFWGPLGPAFGLWRGYPRITVHWGFLEDRVTLVSPVLA